MPNSIFGRETKRTKKGISGRLKLTTGLASNITNNDTAHDIFTIFLIITAVILIIVL